MKITKAADRLLREHFTRDGKICGSAVHTSSGTMPLWGQLVLAGLVRNCPGMGLGHKFSYELTTAGEHYLTGVFARFEHQETSSLPDTRRTFDEIQRAHDLLVGIILAPNMSRDDILPLIGAADVLCWVLQHDHNKTFAANLKECEAFMRIMGYELDKHTPTNPPP